MTSTTKGWPLLAALAILAAGPALAQGQSQPPQPAPGERGREALDKAGEIVTQPARDLGVSKSEIPPILIQAESGPYSLAGLGTCRAISAEVGRLNEALGPDYDGASSKSENRGAALATAGGKAVVNSIIPFRSLVREVSGAAPRQRAMNAAVDAGLARRGFLRGVHKTRGCKTGF